MTDPIIKHLATFPRLNPSPVLETDSTGNIIYSNSASRRILKKINPGQTPDVRLFLPPDIEEITAVLNRTKNTKHLYREIVLFNRYYAENIFLLKKLGVIRIYVQDRTKRKLIQDQKNQFLSMVGHELKTPLTSIKAFEQIIARTCTGACNPQIPRYFKRIDSQIDKLTNLVNDILEFSRLQSGKMFIKKTRFRLDPLLKNTVNDVRTTIADGRLIELKGRAGTSIRADSYRIGQVLTNFLTNAVKYSPESSKVVVTVKKDNDQVVVSVRDFGIGISPSNLKKLFQPYAQVSNSADTVNYPSLGLGLYISSQIIKDHRGRIWCISTLHKGSTFYFSLPLTSK